MTGSLNILIEPTDGAGIADAARALPARAGVVAFESPDASTVLLSATGDLRRFALTRLGESDDATPARREDLRPVTARLRACIVGSSFEGDAVYLDEARWRLPATYRSVLDTRRAWCVRLDPDATTPLWRKLDLVGASARGEALAPETLIGPIGDKDAAGRFGERLDDLFDLCRTPRELEAAPHGRACAYKEMGRCDAPCDGSASMDAYRARVRDAVRFAAQPVALSVSAIEQRMARASDEQDFELAAALKDRARRITKGRRPATSWLTTLDRFAVLGAFPSTRRARARLFIATARRIEAWADVPGKLSPVQASEILDAILSRSRSLLDESGPLRPEQCERLGLLAHHLFHPRRGAGGFLPLDPMPDATALGRLLRQAARVGAEDGASDEDPDTELGPSVQA